MKRTWDVLFSQSANVTVNNSNTETTLISPSRGAISLAPNFFFAGKILRVRGLGFHSVTGTPTLDLKFKIGSTAIFDIGALSIGTGANLHFELEGLITCQAQGASGQLMAAGKYAEYPSSFGTFSAKSLGGNAQQALDTTAGYVMDLTATWSAADPANTSTLSHLIIEQSSGS